MKFDLCFVPIKNAAWVVAVKEAKHRAAVRKVKKAEREEEFAPRFAM